MSSAIINDKHKLIKTFSRKYYGERDDAYQELALALIEYGAAGGDMRCASKVLHCKVLNLNRAYVRSSQYRQRLVEEGLYDGGERVHEQVIVRDVLERVTAKSARWGEVVRLLVVEQRSHIEVAQELGINRQRVYALVRKIRHFLEGEGYTFGWSAGIILA